MTELHRKTKRTFNEPGHAHFLTFSCYHRLPLLTKDRPRHWLIESIDAARRRHTIAVNGYVIMPEHVHLLVYPRRDYHSVSRFLADVKRPVAWKAKQFLLQENNAEWLHRLTVHRGDRDVFRFWQPGGGFDKNLVHQRGLHAVLDYIHANPVRRNLVAHPTDWPWSSARYWQGTRPVPLELDPLPQ